MINEGWPKMDKFLSPDEIVDVLFERFKNAEDLSEFLDHDPIEFHHGLGTGIRNEFFLWHPENPNTMKDYVPEIRDGCDWSPRHPDQVSAMILENVHKKLLENFKLPERRKSGEIDRRKK